jgi:hypothetical protein
MRIAWPACVLLFGEPPNFLFFSVRPSVPKTNRHKQENRDEAAEDLCQRPNTVERPLLPGRRVCGRIQAM